MSLTWLQSIQVKDTEEIEKHIGFAFNRSTFKVTNENKYKKYKNKSLSVFIMWLGMKIKQMEAYENVKCVNT